MDDLEFYANVNVDEVNKVYNKLTNNAPCPICKTGELSFLATEDDTLAVTKQTSNFVTPEGKIDEVTFPTFTLICTTCSTQQTLNTKIIMAALEKEKTDEQE